MPYKITNKATGCDGFAVVKEGTSTPIKGGCHKTRAGALKHLVAIRIGYDEREQPRDADGKFGSGGGSKPKADKPAAVQPVATPQAVATPTVATGRNPRAGSRAKSAPNNVTSKGVNPDSEYVSSEKTGNFFKNPSYNGNPNGAGKVSPAGRNKGQQQDIDELGGGQKFQETGQSKHRDDNPPPTQTTPKASTAASPPTSGQTKVGRTLPRQVKGKEIDCADPEFQRKIKAAADGPQMGNDPVLDVIAKEQGFDGPPMRLESNNQSNEMVRDGFTRNFRGTKSDSSNPKEYGQQYVEGEYHAGLGVYGNGTYMTNNELTAKAYAGDGRFGQGSTTYGEVNETLISPDARIIGKANYSTDDDDVSVFRDAQRVKLGVQREAAMRAGDKRRLREIDAMDSALQDYGRAAALMGADGFQIAGTGRFKINGKGVTENYTVILNRTATASRVRSTHGTKFKPRKTR